MARKNKSIEALATAIKKKPIKRVNPLDGLDAYSDIVNQFDLDKHPRFIYQAIREAQKVRIDSVDEHLSLYSNTYVTLTVNEKNFVIVHEQDIKKGILRECGHETMIRIDELIEEQNNAD